jgi:hypothetical protein
MFADGIENDVNLLIQDQVPDGTEQGEDNIHIASVGRKSRQFTDLSGSGHASAGPKFAQNGLHLSPENFHRLDMMISWIVSLCVVCRDPDCGGGAPILEYQRGPTIRALVVAVGKNSVFALGDISK